MKIKSIRVTSDREEAFAKEFHESMKFTSAVPIIKVDYEETTPTGLVAKGSRELSGEFLEIVVSFFKELEIDILTEIENGNL